MVWVPVHVTLINGLDEIQAHQGEMPAEDVRRLDVDAVIDTRYYYRLLPEAVVEQLGLTVMWRGTAHPDGAWREGYVTSLLTVEIFGRRGSMDALVMGDIVHLDGTLLGQTDLRYDEASDLIVPNLGTWEQMIFRI
jgi:hypothetical protein